MALRSGSLERDVNDRGWASLVQFLLIFVFSMGFFNYSWLLDSEGIFYVFWLVLVLLFLVGLVYYTVAFYLTLRDNIPRMVKTKNTVWLFVFTLVFFEGLVMTGLFWLIYFILSLASTPLCYDPLCYGSVLGVFMWINIITSVCLYVLIRSRRLLGIPILDTFGL
eukprot:TRINITY_DN1290_c0_g1_i2.p1 TRINITY_DN1290_c0_g1~~TRINITY_DN1290_c0_g1_i2.p1  ORF type:complete len:165 (-),score=8.29 TRINITY_DN1290_c0_g1_i2:85-579(-)